MTSHSERPPTRSDARSTDATRLICSWLAAPGAMEPAGIRPSAIVWAEIATLAKRHGLAGLLLRRLHALELAPPPETLAELRAQASRALFLGLRAQRAFAAAASLLHEAQCSPVVALKGVHLLACLYDSPGERPLTDVDILIAAPFRERAHQALLSASFQYVPKPPGRPASQRAHYERSYLGPDGVLIDVHTALTQPERARLDYSAILERAASGRPHPWAPTAFSPHPNHTPLLLAIHQAQDCFAGPFRQLVDLAWWLQANPPNARELAEQATQAGAATVLWVALRQARLRLSAQIDPALEGALAPARGLRRWYLEQLLDAGRLQPYPFSHAKRLAQQLTLWPLLDSPSQAARLAKHYATLRAADALHQSVKQPF